MTHFLHNVKTYSKNDSLTIYFCCEELAQGTANRSGEVSKKVCSKLSEPGCGNRCSAIGLGKEKQTKKSGERLAREFGYRKECSGGIQATAGPVKARKPSPAGEEKREPPHPIKEPASIHLSSSEEDLTQGEEEGLGQEPAACTKAGGSKVRLRKPLNSSAPLLPPTYDSGGGPNSFLSPADQRQLQLAFPVFEAAEGAHVYAPVDYRQVKELAEAVRAYGIGANFTVAQVERLATAAMTPGDWQNTVKAVLNNMGQYLEWKALWHEALQAQARINANTEGQELWTFDMLAGVGVHANDQTAHPWQVYAQTAAAAIKAWKSLPRKEGSNLYLSKIIQAANESFSDFVARMTEAAGRIFGDPEQSMPLIEQMVFENATAECRAAIAPRRAKGLQDWLRVCRGLGGPLTNAGLAAANLEMAAMLLKGQNRGTFPSKHMARCYACGKAGHRKRECPNNQIPMKLCTRGGRLGTSVVIIL
uniref:endogenous retrovirus group K member 5 Gag polyprotein-like n=1 Tax=Arvicanthis niloticus TaxID=61156 RepID=UPI00402B1F6D